MCWGPSCGFTPLRVMSSGVTLRAPGSRAARPCRKVRPGRPTISGSGHRHVSSEPDADVGAGFLASLSEPGLELVDVVRSPVNGLSELGERSREPDARCDRLEARAISVGRDVLHPEALELAPEP